MSTHRAFPAISAVVDLPADLAQEAFDLVASEGMWSVPADSGRLEFDGPGIIPSASTRPYWPVRRVEGRLRPTGSRRGLPVRLELLPWSDSRTEIVLTLAEKPGRFAARHPRGYLEAGHQTIDALRAAMQDWPAALLDRLMRWGAGEELTKT